MPTWPRLLLLALPALVACSFTSSGDDDDDDDGSSSSDDTGWWEDSDDGGSGGGDGGSGDGGSGAGDGGSGDGGSGLEWPEGDATGCSLAGDSFVLDLEGARFVQPDVIRTLLDSANENDLALKVKSQSAGSAQVFMALVDGSGQDLCTETIDLPAAAWDDPVLSIGPADVTMDFGGYTVTLSDFAMAVAATDDCRDLRDGAFTSELDIRVMAPLFEDLMGTSNPSTICDLIEGFGASCGACSSDGQDYCLVVAVDRLDGEGGVLDLQAVTAADVAGNPDCY